MAGNHAIEVLALIDVAKKTGRVLGVLALGPNAAAVGKPNIGLLCGHRQHVRVKIAKRCGEQQTRAVLRNHARHRLLHRRRFRHVFFLHHFDAGHFFKLGCRLRVGLVVAIVVARTDVNHPHSQRLLGAGEFAPGA